MPRYVLALDQGTTSSRAIVFDRHGRPRAQARQEFAAHEEADLDDPSDEIPEGDRSGDGFPPVDHGTRAARLEPDDEASLGQSLVEEGISDCVLED